MKLFIFRRSCRIALLPAATAIALTAGLTAQPTSSSKKHIPRAATKMDEHQRAVHALNRFTFGPRPGDVDRVVAMGVDQWIEEQLHPDKIDDSALDARLESFRTLRMDTKELVENFPPNQLIRQIADGKASMPHDPVKRAVYETQVERYEEQKQKKEQAANRDPKTSLENANVTSTMETATAQNGSDADIERRDERRTAALKTQALLDLPPEERMKQILEMSPEDRHALAASTKGAKADALFEGMNPKQKETVESLNNPEQVVVNELQQAKLVRAIYSERQLDEVMTDFWINHFNVFINKGADRYLLTSYERQAIRPHALGKFEDLLVATAKDPAMMFYLDNWLSVGPRSEIALGIPEHPHPYQMNRPHKPKQSSGLNENYGRELMELHTLSVNGGYTQKDVTEVAKVFTGWTLDPPKKGAGFRFEPRMHEPGDKLVLGHRIKSNGEKEGLQVLHLLAHDPHTAHFISEKLAIRFVSDNPPPALVDRMAQCFLKKDGDIREVLRTMLRSPEFWTGDAYRAKVKTPLEFVVSAVRASGADVEDARALVGTLNNMGMPLYGMVPPTGYSMKAETWVNSSALLGRMNFALRLTAGKVNGTKVVSTSMVGVGSAQDAAGDSQQVLALLEGSLLNGDISKQTHDTITKQLDDPAISQRRLDDAQRPPNVAAITGLILGSPEFQKR
jgi:uncharacterized protein (DUF1800 family)